MPPIVPWTPLMAAAFIGYIVFALTVIVFLVFYVAPMHGTSNIFVYIGICSLAGSLSVMSCKVSRRHSSKKPGVIHQNC